MANIKELLNSLRKTLSKSEVDTTKYSLSLNKLNQQRFTKQTTQNNNILGDVNKLLTQVVPTIPTNIVNLFNTAKTLYQTVPEMYQGVNTVVDNVLSPDSVTKSSINKIIEVENDFAKSEIENKLDSIFTVCKLEDFISELTLDFILFGNAYMWIKTPGELKRLEMVKEMVELTKNKDRRSIGSFLAEDFSFSIFLPKHKGRTLREIDVNTNEEKESYPIEQIDLEKLSVFNCAPIYIGRKFLGLTLVTVSSQTVDIRNMQISVNFGTDVTYIKTLADMMYKTLTQKIKTLKQLTDPDNSETLDVFYALASYVIQNNLKVRGVVFIPADYCVHFKIPSTIFDPYGEPFGMGSMQVAKYLIAAEMSQIVYRLTRAVEKRVFKVNAQEEHAVAKYIQDIINVTKRKEIAIRNAPDTETIINEVTMFEDYYIPTVNGESALEIESIPAADLTGRMDDLDYFRKKVISGLGIPAIYLIQEDTSESKYTLSQENIKFARMIVKLQKYFGKSLTDLVRKIYNLCFSDYTNVNSIYLQLKPPRAIQIEKDAEIAENVNRIITAVKENAGDSFDTKKFITDTLRDVLGADYIISEKTEQKAQRLDKFIKKSDEETGGI